MNTHTKKSNSEKPVNIEQQFQVETGENFSEIENLKVSEAVGETVGENFSDGTKPTKQTKTQEEKEEPVISSSRAQKIILPTIEKQRMKVKRALEKEQKQLIQKAKKLQNSRKFSASTLEDTYRAIRKLQSLLNELLRAAGKRITELYHRFVLKNG